MNRIALVAALGVIAGIATIAGPAAADSSSDASFETVDAYEIRATQIVVTGVQTGATAASTRELPLFTSSGEQDRRAAACERMLALSFNKPGKFRVKYTYDQSARGHCSIERR